MYDINKTKVSPQSQGICVVYSILKAISVLYGYDFLSLERSFIEFYNRKQPLLLLEELCKNGLEATICLTIMLIKADADLRPKYDDFIDVNYKFLVGHFVKSIKDFDGKKIEYKESIDPTNDNNSVTTLLKDNAKTNVACVSIHNDEVKNPDDWRCHCFLIAYDGTKFLVIDPNVKIPYPLEKLLSHYTPSHFGDGIYLEA